MENVNPNIQLRTTYVKDHPALAPLNTLVDDYPAAGVLSGGEILREQLAAVSQQRRTREVLVVSHHATEAELLESQIRETSMFVESVSTNPLDQDWVQGLVQESANNNTIMQNNNTTMQDNNTNMLQVMNTMNDRLDAIIGRMDVDILASNGRMDADILASNERMDAHVLALNGRMDADILASNGRMDADILASNERMDVHVQALNGRMRSEEPRLNSSHSIASRMPSSA